MAKNIYFVEFGNYDGNNTVDKQVFPVKAETLSMHNAYEKLAHLMSILHKNCVVSIAQLSPENFDYMYNMETGTLVPYDVTFVLITCVEREISTENFDTFVDARKQMIKEVIESIKDDEDLLNDYYEYQEANGNYDGDELGIYLSSAWANADCGDENYDWRIIVC